MSGDRAGHRYPIRTQTDQATRKKGFWQKRVTRALTVPKDGVARAQLQIGERTGAQPASADD